MTPTGSDIVRSHDRLLGLDKRSEWAICDRMADCVLRSRLPRLDAARQRRQMCIDPLRWDRDGPSTPGPLGTTNRCLPEAQTVGGTSLASQYDAVTMRELIFTSSEPRDKKQGASPACV